MPVFLQQSIPLLFLLWSSLFSLYYQLKTEAQIIEKYNNAGGYSGTAKHLGVIAGPTFNEAVLNARDYGILLSLQSDLVTSKRFPGFNLSTLVATPGSLDSQW